jgi:hypothetical protein
MKINCRKIVAIVIASAPLSIINLSSSPTIAASSLPSCVRVSKISTSGNYSTITVINGCPPTYYAQFKVISDLPGVVVPSQYRSCMCLFPGGSKTLVVPSKFHLEGCTIFTGCPI